MIAAITWIGAKTIVPTSTPFISTRIFAVFRLKLLFGVFGTFGNLFPFVRSELFVKRAKRRSLVVIFDN